MSFCSECELTPPHHAKACRRNQETIEEIKALLRRYLGDDSPLDISNMASNIHKIYRP